MPHDAPSVKRTATTEYGATVIPYNRNEVRRESLSSNLAAKKNLPIIPPYDHPHIVAGQGTAALELMQDRSDLDMLLVPRGGGGLLSGSALAAKSIPWVIGVEPDTANDAALSFIRPAFCIPSITQTPPQMVPAHHHLESSRFKSSKTM